MATLEKCRFTRVQWVQLTPLLTPKAREFVMENMAAEPSTIIVEPDVLELHDETLVYDESILPIDKPNDPEAESTAQADQSPPDEPKAWTAMPDGGADGAKEPEGPQNIRDIVNRIESFKRARDFETSPSEQMTQLPLGDLDEEEINLLRLDFLTDPDGNVTAASHHGLIGTKIFTVVNDGEWGCNQVTYQRFQNRMAIRSGLVALPDSSGDVRRVVAKPLFDEQGGYIGYSGAVLPVERAAVLSRPAPDQTNDHVNISRSDDYRQLIHELKTPVGALKGFAEILQSQLFGPVSSQYRQMANVIVKDSDILLSHFNHLQHFEQDGTNMADTTALPSCSARHCMDCLDRVVQTIIPMRDAKFVMESGGDQQLDANAVNALLDWFDYFVASFSKSVSITFSETDDHSSIRCVFSGQNLSRNMTIRDQNDEKLAFALLLTEARLLESGIKIASEPDQTIMDLPVIPVMTPVV